MTDKHKRKEFPKSVRLEIWNRANGHCEECGKKAFPGKFVYDHIVPDALGGKPTLENGKLLCANEPGSCNHIKTYGTKTNRSDGDIPKLAKVKRLQKKHASCVVAPKRNTSKHKAVLFGNKQSPWKKKLDGTVVRRAAS